MRDHDALEKNPNVSKAELEAIHGQLFGWALSRCGFDAATAEDLMQQAYVELLSGRARFDNKSALKTFVFGVVQNLARSRFRGDNKHLRLIDKFTTEQDDSTEDNHDHHNWNRVWEAVVTLPQRQRDITELVFIRDMTIEEASAVMGVSLGTGRVHYDRAKKALAEKLAELNPAE
ncbi:MAG: RNA polymerase sigma factor [Woeseiaceae bacterium]